MTKAKMIETLKLQEAKQWTLLEGQKAWCKVFYQDIPMSEWTGVVKDALTIYEKEWCATYDTLRLLEIEPYTWSERNVLIEQGKL